MREELKVGVIVVHEHARIFILPFERQFMEESYAIAVFFSDQMRLITFRGPIHCP
jgi:hypothetical protein